MTGLWRLRAGVLALVGVLAVHHGRYAIVPPEHGHEFAAAHGYFVWLMPLAGALLFLAAAQLAAVVAGRLDADAPELPGVRTLWVGATLTLLHVFAAQELLEGALAHGHVPGLQEVLGNGGWVALPLAAVVGAAAALALRGAAEVVWRALGRRVPRRARGVAAPTVSVAPLLAPGSCVLARFLAGRAPPALG